MASFSRESGDAFSALATPRGAADAHGAAGGGGEEEEGGGGAAGGAAGAGVWQCDQRPTDLVWVPSALQHGARGAARRPRPPPACASVGSSSSLRGPRLVVGQGGRTRASLSLSLAGTLNLAESLSVAIQYDTQVRSQTISRRSPP